MDLQILVARARAVLGEPPVEQVLVVRSKWATFFDYGFTEEAEEGFPDSAACEAKAAENEKERGRHMIPLFGKHGELPHFFCRQADEHDLIALAIRKEASKDPVGLSHFPGH
ncbi:hypothetical protein [Eleftheria terrae]|uniref:hypothetical protein n=1 Tax=Eleftheria terrae TaxID=1597781 RepID=UPI00263AB0CF|nr:hypothetical protein [Eleftheria terrae]